MKVYLLWAYTQEVIYGQTNSNRDVIKVFVDENEAQVEKRKLQETVGKKFNVEYRVEEKDLICETGYTLTGQKDTDTV